MLPPSATAGVAARLTVVTSASSEMVVVAVAVVSRLSKLPPLLEAIDTV